jgi:hypothetical protein
MGLRDLMKAAKDSHLPSMVKEAWRRGNPKQLELSRAFERVLEPHIGENLGGADLHIVLNANAAVVAVLIRGCCGPH